MPLHHGTTSRRNSSSTTVRQTQTHLGVSTVLVFRVSPVEQSFAQGVNLFVIRFHGYISINWVRATQHTHKRGEQCWGSATNALMLSTSREMPTRITSSRKLCETETNDVDHPEHNSIPPPKDYTCPIAYKFAHFY